MPTDKITKGSHQAFLAIYAIYHDIWPYYAGTSAPFESEVLTTRAKIPLFLNKSTPIFAQKYPYFCTKIPLLLRATLSQGMRSEGVIGAVRSLSSQGVCCFHA